MKWTDFLFVDNVTGDEFLVEVHDTPDAQSDAEAIAQENFEEPKLICQISEEEGEMLGLDTY